MSDVNIRFTPEGTTVYGGLPAYATPGSIGLDLRACFGAEHLCDAQGRFADIAPGGRVAVPVGLAIAPLPGSTTGADDADQPTLLAGFVYSRSGLGAQQGLTVAQGVGVIDPDYRGELIVMLLNTSNEQRRVRQGERIAQLVFQPVARPTLHAVDELDTTERGAGGFGHTGR